jgi:hypothetical protein
MVEEIKSRLQSLQAGRPRIVVDTDWHVDGAGDALVMFEDLVLSERPIRNRKIINASHPTSRACLRSTMPAGLELTNGLFRVPGEVTCDKLRNAEAYERSMSVTSNFGANPCFLRRISRVSNEPGWGRYSSPS